MNTASIQKTAPKNLDTARSALASAESAYLEGAGSYDAVVAARAEADALEAARAEEQRLAEARAAEERAAERQAAAERAAEEERAARVAREAIPRRRLAELVAANPPPRSRVPCFAAGDVLERAAKAAASFVRLHAEAEENLRAWREREREISAILTELGEGDQVRNYANVHAGAAVDVELLLAGVRLAFASTSWADFARRCRAQAAPFTPTEIIAIARAVSSKATGLSIAPREPTPKEAAELAAARGAFAKATEVREAVFFSGRVPRSKDEREDAQKVEAQRDRAQMDLEAARVNLAEVVGRLEAANVAVEPIA